MSEQFQFDTSGWVDPAENPSPLRARLAWRDLSPGVQGCISAMLEEGEPAFVAQCIERNKGTPEEHIWSAGSDVGFSDLHPDTLARIIADWEAWCAKVEEAYSPYVGPGASLALTMEDGINFHRWRQSGNRDPEHMEHVPPVIIYLDEAGKVCVRDV